MKAKEFLQISVVIALLLFVSLMSTRATELIVNGSIESLPLGTGWRC